MNKKELIRATAETTGMTQKDCAAVLDALLAATAKELASGGEVSITGFGALRVKERAARKGINPKTGETIDIPAGKGVSFKAGATLLDEVCGK
ncbi:MAG: HU family DNA-binding protein [Clostridia bacterium]|nr:HU family DNA-binding protein [Clostridia bacterium]